MKLFGEIRRLVYFGYALNGDLRLDPTFFSLRRPSRPLPQTAGWQFSKLAALTLEIEQPLNGDSARSRSGALIL